MTYSYVKGDSKYKYCEMTTKNDKVLLICLLGLPDIILNDLLKKIQELTKNNQTSPNIYWKIELCKKRSFFFYMG